MACAPADRKTNMHYLNPLFVTVDYENDNEEKLRNVVDLFNSNHNRKHVRLTGLTGPDTVKVRLTFCKPDCSKDAVHQVARSGVLILLAAVSLPASLASADTI